MLLIKISKIVIYIITMVTITAFFTIIGSANKLDFTTTQKQYASEIITAQGKLEGSMTQHIEGLPFTGNVSLHYSATNTGFNIFDTSVLIIKLPEEFKNVASISEFKEKLVGTLHLQTILGQKSINITSDMVDSYPDRIIIKAPSTFWSGVGEFSADLYINYGEFLEENNQLDIPDAPDGYKFITQLQYSPSVWDFTQHLIIGTNEDTYISKETSASIN